MDQATYIAVIAKLTEIIEYANANADADPSAHAAETWRSHARNVEYVRDKIAAQTKN